jgi:hypothetical protein
MGVPVAVARRRAESARIGLPDGETGEAMKGDLVQKALETLRVWVAKPDPMTTLPVEPLEGGAVVYLTRRSTADDPSSLALVALLDDPSPSSVRAS